MRKTSMVMGIIGGALALLFGTLYIFGSGTLGSENNDASVSFGGTIFLVIGICMIVGGILGFIGGLIVKTKNVAAGVLMIIAAVLGINLFSLVLFILGAVFALRRERQQIVYAPPYPMPPYYPYPPQHPQQFAQQPQYPQPPYPPQAYQQHQAVQQPAPPVENPPENPQP